MGSVYLLEDLATGRRYALKLLRSELVASREHVERFTREARAIIRCAHPNVVEVIDTGFLADGRAFILMEYLEGEDLAATLRAAKRLLWPQVRHIALQICDALAAAHARGIVHRDLKPANCFRITCAGDPDFIKVLDFGVAKLLDRTYETLTSPGELVGTPRYMAPEQVQGGAIDHRVDIYALGAMLYHMLTGQTAATGENNLELIYSLMMRSPEPFSVVAPDVVLPAGVWLVVERAMARDPAQRFASMQAFAAALTAIPVPTVHEPRAPLARPVLFTPSAKQAAARDVPETWHHNVARADASGPGEAATHDVPGIHHHLVTPVHPAATPGPRVASPPARPATAERPPLVLASVGIVFSGCVLWVGSFAAVPSPSLTVAKPLSALAAPRQSSFIPPDEISPPPETASQPVTPVATPNHPNTNPAVGSRIKRRRPVRSSPQTPQDVIDARKQRYNLCQRDELLVNPSAPRRYTWAISIGPQGQTEGVEVLSMASPTMTSCIETVTRALTFPAPSEGSARPIVTLSFPRPP